MKSIYAASLAVATALAIGVASASSPAADSRDELILSVLGNFWGSARDVAGKPIEPASERERAVVPVPMSVAYRALEAGEASGLAEWCGLPWEPHYFSITNAARSLNMTDTQVAFVSVLHGAAQGAVARSMQGKTCDSASKVRANARLAASQARGLAVSTEPQSGTWPNNSIKPNLLRKSAYLGR